MPDSLCPLTVAVCSTVTRRAVDLTLPADVHLGQLLPQIVDIVHRDAEPVTGCDWRLSRMGDLPLDESMSLNDNNVRAGDFLLLTTVEPAAADWVDYDPCRAMVATGAAVDTPILRILPAICCVLLGGFGAVALVLPSARVTGLIITASCLALAAAGGAAVVQRVHGDPLICVPLSLVAVLYAGAVGFLAVPAGPNAAGLLLASAAMFSATILLMRVTDRGRTCLTALAAVCAVVVAGSVAAAGWNLQLSAAGAVIVTLSLATLGFAPRLSMVLSGSTPEATPNVALCHRTLTGLVLGGSFTVALGATSVAIGEIRDAGSALRGTAFAAIVSLVLLLRVRSYADSIRRAGVTAAAVLTATAGLAAAVISWPAQAHIVSALAAGAGAGALGCLVRPTVSPIALRAAEIVEYLALATLVPMACWVAGLYGWAREMNLV